MKKTYITLFLFTIILLFILVMYFVKIPSPSKAIVETYILDVK